MTKAITISLLFAASALTPAAALAQDAGGYIRIDGGVAVTPAQGSAKRVTVTVHGGGIFHVIAAPEGMTGVTRETSLMVPTPPEAGDYTVAERDGHVLVRTAHDTADIDLGTGEVRFLGADGRTLLDQAGQPAFTPTTIDGHGYVEVSQQFNRGTDEGLYGLGQHQNSQMNYNGEDVELAQHNMDIAVPFLVSTRNYGILWDNNSITRFGNPEPYRFVGDGLKVTSGGRPGFTAKYYLGDKLAVTRREQTIDYQYIEDQAKWPAAAKADTVAADSGQNTAGNAVQTQRVVWTGELTPDRTGMHKFRLYGSSYFKVFMDGREVLNRWRQNWNPWYANFQYPMTRGKPVEVRIEWEPNAGYMAFFHNKPLADADRHSVWFTSEVGRAVNYWFVPGKDMDDVIAGYRKLTGKAVMLPKWAYGFWQSRQRYENQDQLVDVVEQYRKRDIPLDNIVQDWFYWPEDAWGSHEFDKARYPDPQGMIDKVHDLNAHFMISVWPKFYPTTDNYKELDAKGYTYHGNLEMGNKDWVGPGYLNTDYDPYAPEARRIYWRQIKESLADLGVDAWWMDATEPDIHSNLSIADRKKTMGPTARGPAAEYFNSFPLVHAEGVHDGWRRYKPDVRPFILTRSGFGGLQRAGAALWSGDVASRWYDLRAQISAGVNLSMSGIPNWTHDIGGFALESRYSAKSPKPDDLDEWRELNLRWFQFGAFSPLFRSHGEYPVREIYEISPDGSPMRKAMVWYDELRYRLMPYIYTQAADTWFDNGSIMRGLVMDFPDDARARNINDEYLFGRALLVAPVTEYKARAREVYLPRTAGGWYDFYSGQRIAGGDSVNFAAPASRIPLFVRAGSIVPLGPVQQYTGQKPDAPVTLNVYTGADGAFALYEDDGTSEGYRTGEYSRIPIRYDDASGSVIIGAREGRGYAAMPANRTFRVRWITPGRTLDLDGKTDATVQWSGEPVTVKRP
ncbi:TIM-barrel domain-containing protein [Stakelama saccharophila]|uniref:Glycoside hydrolase family 31 protein n=1 Tax=Stakelama saccharophila TaxID=3075605 RepID=A0ABZ0B637_9SPHN|nr:TIM-barrel domain-containing protein [Stakelama sp. W311]WNO52843.1 glycoside hydrolase family 31 protein [Stakelama sp. W311]